jgi:hypothetical protein
MRIPTPDEFTKAGGYKPFPPRWNRWLSALREGILSAQPQAGRHVSVDEHPGKGTVINVADTSARRKSAGGGVCPDVEAITIVTSEIILDCPCRDHWTNSGADNQSWLYTDALSFPGVNGTWNLSASGTYFFEGEDGLHNVSLSLWSGSPTCSGDPDPGSPQDDAVSACLAYCLAGVWTVYIYDASPAWALIFRGRSPGPLLNGGTITNDLPNCGLPIVANEFPEDPFTIGRPIDGKALVIAHGGNVTLSW